MPERREHPVLWGLLALALVSAALGVILGLGTLAVSRVVGLGGGGTSGSADDQASMYLPRPSKTESSDGGGAESQPPPSDRPKPTKSAEPETLITLTAGQTAVSPMQQIDLTGTYPGGDGAILQVQRFDAGSWVSFPVTVSVSGGQFSTYIQTGRTGVNRFRVTDRASGEASNEIRVTIG